MDRPTPYAIAQASAAAALDRAKTLTKGIGDDPQLTSWAAGMVAAADEFTKRKRPDPLGGFVHAPKS